MSTSLFDPTSTALLVMDVQEIVVDMLQDADAFLRNEASAISVARGAGIPIVYVVVGFRAGLPEISPRNKFFSTVRTSGRFDPSNRKVRIHAAVSPAADDVVVTKHRVNAFFGTDLDMVLRARGIETVVLTGISTSGVVLSTLRYASDADYRVVVVADCCADPDGEVHRVLIDRVFPRQADVITLQTFADACDAM